MVPLGRRARILVFLLVLLLALACVVQGVYFHHPLNVLVRAATICLECIGLG